MPLTHLELRRSKPKDKPYTLNDGNGLSVLVEPNGSKGWRFRYRFDGKPKMISFGTYPTMPNSCCCDSKMSVLIVFW